MKKFRIFGEILAGALALALVCPPALATQTTGSAATAPEDTTVSTTAPTQTEPQETVPSSIREDYALTDRAVQDGCRTLDAQVPLYGTDAEIEKVSSYLLYELNSGTMLYAHEADLSIYPSSLVKIMTALVALENGDPEDLVTVTSNALATVDPQAITVGLKIGEEITVQQLLYCLLTGNGNDAAAVLAEYALGNQTAFVVEMNRRAHELGCTGTHYINASGIHDDRQVTTARDTAKILQEALKHPAFVQAFEAANYVMEATNKADSRYFATTNYLDSREITPKYYDDRVLGGRTGTLESDNRNLAVTATDGELTYLAVLLDAESLPPAFEGASITVTTFTGATALFDKGFQNLEIINQVYPGEIIDQFPVSGGENDLTAYSRNATRMLLPREDGLEKLEQRTELIHDPISAPIAKEQKVGILTMWYGNVCVAQADLLSTVDVRVKTVVNPQEEAQEQRSGLQQGLVVLGICVVLVLAGIGAMQVVQNRPDPTPRPRRKRSGRP